MSESIATDRRMRTIDGFAPLWVFVVLILLCSVVGTSAVYLLDNSRTLAFDCVAESCPSSLVNELQMNSKALVQDFNFEISLHVLPSALKGTLNNPQQITEGSASRECSLYSFGNGKYLVSVPGDMERRVPLATYLHLKDLSSVRVRVQGQEMYILNGRTAYTHRYQLADLLRQPSKSDFKFSFKFGIRVDCSRN